MKFPGDTQSAATIKLDDQTTAGPDEPQAQQASTVNRTIGPYNLVRRIGQGGMGEVWFAEQLQPVRRRVALKLVRAGTNSDEVVARFAYERQALAMMEHPAIARVYDAGSTSEGQPYFAMEYVDGSPITEYSDVNRLSIADRIQLFIRVCEGVQHAHQKAILHRDLKPSNVLVAEHDGRATPRIIDFGLAKAIGQTPADAVMVTQVGSVLGTPLYMSPEQAQSDQGNIDTRTDVYSLGVILYELLIGTTPFDPSKLAFDQLLRAIREDDPPRPSARLLQLDPDKRQTVVEQRRTSVPVLRRQLATDLDWIVLKTLEKDRERRYSSPAELAADLNCWLDHKPIIARPPSRGYRMQKFVRRHRLGVTFASALAILLLGFGATMAIQSVRIAHERDRADQNRSEATKQAQVALDKIYQQVTTTDAKLNSLPGTTQLRKELLEGAMKNLDEISRTVATSNWADRTMGVALQRMADFAGGTNAEEAVQVLERSLQIFNRLLKEDPDQDWTAFDAAISYDALGEINRDVGADPAKSYQYYEKALQIREGLVQKIHQPEPSLYKRQRSIAVSHMKISALALEMHDPNKAADHGEKAEQSSLTLATLENSKVDDHRELLASSYRVLAGARSLIGQSASARQTYEQAEKLVEEWIKAQPINVQAKKDFGRIQIAHGDMELDLGDLDAAMKKYREAETNFDALAKNDKDDLESQWYRANAQYASGRALASVGRNDEGQQYFRQSLPTREKLAADAPSIARQIELMLTNAQLGEKEKVLTDARKVEDFAPRNPGKLFSTACAYSLLWASEKQKSGDTSSDAGSLAGNAIRLLRAAIANGFRDRWTLEKAQELQGIRSLTEYQQLLNELPPVGARSDASRP